MYALELAHLIQDDKNDISIQHILQIGDYGEPYIIKHWRQDWSYQNQDFYLYDYHLGNFFFDSEYKNIKLLLFSILLLLIFTRILGKRNYSRINYKTIIYRIFFDRDNF